MTQAEDFLFIYIYMHSSLCKHWFTFYWFTLQGLVFHIALGLFPFQISSNTAPLALKKVHFKV